MIQDQYKPKRCVELKWEHEECDGGRYTLFMVRVDYKIRPAITGINLVEATIAHRKNSVEGAAHKVSVAT